LLQHFLLTIVSSVVFSLNLGVDILAVGQGIVTSPFIHGSCDSVRAADTGIK
jgi:hypothetical protein